VVNRLSRNTIPPPHKRTRPEFGVLPFDDELHCILQLLAGYPCGLGESFPLDEVLGVTTGSAPPKDGLDWMAWILMIGEDVDIGVITTRGWYRLS